MTLPLIPLDYWNGRDTLKLRYPWLAPAASVAIDKFLTSSMDVLEFGSGGSTLFFADRAKSVLSFETLDHWYPEVAACKPDNVWLHLVKTYEEILPIIGERMFDLCLVDICNISRPDLVRLSMKHVKSPGLVVLDNFSAEYSNGCLAEFAGLKQENYYDQNFVGSGTKIYYM